MKKIISVLLVALMTFPVSAQISRSGNSYLVDGQVMNKKSFATYMQQNAENDLASKFKSGLKTANVGWGLFGGGIGLSLAGLITTGASGVAGANADAKGKSTEQVGGAVAGAAAAGIAMYLIGGAMTTASIVCLGVGYGRMHNASDTYAAISNSQRQKPLAYIQLQTSQNGLGLAVKF